MSRPQRIAQYIQRLESQGLMKQVERDERPEDAPPRVPETQYSSWSPTSFFEYVPFRGPTYL